MYLLQFYTCSEKDSAPSLALLAFFFIYFYFASVLIARITLHVIRCLRWGRERETERGNSVSREPLRVVTGGRPSTRKRV